MPIFQLLASFNLEYYTASKILVIFIYYHCLFSCFFRFYFCCCVGLFVCAGLVDQVVLWQYHHLCIISHGEGLWTVRDANNYSSSTASAFWITNSLACQLCQRNIKRCRSQPAPKLTQPLYYLIPFLPILRPTIHIPTLLPPASYASMSSPHTRLFLLMSRQLTTQSALHFLPNVMCNNYYVFFVQPLFHPTEVYHNISVIDISVNTMKCSNDELSLSPCHAYGRSLMMLRSWRSLNVRLKISPPKMTCANIYQQ